MDKGELKKLLDNYKTARAEVEYELTSMLLDQFGDEEYEQLVNNHPKLFKCFINKSKEEILKQLPELESLNKFLIDYLESKEYENDLVNKYKVVKLSVPELIELLNRIL